MAHRALAMGTLGALALGLLLACSDPADEPLDASTKRSGRLSVYAVNAPLAYFAERIGGEHVEVVLPVPPDQDPAYWSPSAEIVAAYQSADLILENGAGYARWIRHASLPRARRVDTSVEFQDHLIEAQGSVSHGHGPGGEHSHLDTAFTVWLDPNLASQQAHAISVAMIRLRPAAKDDFRAGLAALEADLLDLDRRFATALGVDVEVDVDVEMGTVPGETSRESVLFSHPVYQYFARRYQLRDRSLHWEPGKMPGPDAWRELEAMLAEEPARIMIWEATPHPEAESRLRTLGVQVVIVAPGGNSREAGDWLALMYANAERLRAVEFSSLRP